MSNLLKSKFLLGVLSIAVMFVGAVAVATTASADCSITTTLRLGSKGPEVACLQAALGTTADGSFGPMTQAKVMAFQTAHGLTADGVFGAMSRAAWMANGSVSGNFPAGCQSASGYSVTTGKPCNSGPSAGLPAGCSSTSGFSMTTGQPCSGGSSSTGGALTGGAGDLTLSDTSTDVKDKVKEGDTEKVLGFKAEADGSDVEVSSVKVTLSNTGNTTDSSENLARYADEVSIWMGSTKVGSADVSDFTKDSASPDEFSKTISLSNAVIRDNKDAKIYVGVTASDNIDSDDIDNAAWTVELNTVRFTDATGAILTADVGDVNDQEFTFEDASTDDQIDLKSSTSNPSDKTVQVEENSTSDEYTDLAFKLDVDEDSSDVDVTALTLTAHFTNLDTQNDNDVDASDDSTSDSAAENIIDSVMVKIGSQEYEADLDSGSVSIANGSGTATYTTDDIDDLTIDSGDVVEGKVNVTFNDQEDNYNEGATVQFTLDNDDIDAETADDEIDVGGGEKSGAVLTVRANGADFAYVSSTSTASGDDDQNGKFTLKFSATAFGDDIQIPKAGADSIDFEIRDASDDSVYLDNSDIAAGLSVSLSSTTGADVDDSNDDDADAFLVSDTESFLVTVTLNNDTVGMADGQYYLAITGIHFYPNDTDALTSVVVDDDTFQSSPTHVGVTP